jgi:hypothetical protein
MHAGEMQKVQEKSKEDLGLQFLCSFQMKYISSSQYVKFYF